MVQLYARESYLKDEIDTHPCATEQIPMYKKLHPEVVSLHVLIIICYTSSSCVENNFPYPPTVLVNAKHHCVLPLHVPV